MENGTIHVLVKLPMVASVGVLSTRLTFPIDGDIVQKIAQVCFLFHKMIVCIFSFLIIRPPTLYSSHSFIYRTIGKHLMLILPAQCRYT